MKRDEIKKILSAPRAEQEQALKENRERYRALKFDLDAGKVKNVAELRKIKKNIARLLTVLNQNHGTGK
ncbi:MAG: 50S ribosomal protein L29 [Candidatus Liptonbacteria bacterium]